MYASASTLDEPLVEKPRVVRVSSAVLESALAAKIAKRKLLIGTALCFCFMVAEIVSRGRWTRRPAARPQPLVQQSGVTWLDSRAGCARLRRTDSSFASRSPTVPIYIKTALTHPHYGWTALALPFLYLLVLCSPALLASAPPQVGGYLAHSLAIITDAAHMLSDIAGFLVGVLSIFLTSRAADPKYSFGYHIAEVRDIPHHPLMKWCTHPCTRAGARV